MVAANARRAAHMAGVPAAVVATADMVRRLIAAGRTIDVTIPDGLEAQKAACLRMGSDLDVGEAAHGFVLLVVREQMTPGEWLTWLQEHNLPPRRVQERMQIARFLRDLSDQNRQRVARAALRVQIKLARIGAGRVTELIDEGDYDHIMELPGKARTKELSTVANLHRRVDRFATRVTELEAQLSGQETGRTGQMPPSVIGARIDASVYAASIMDLLDQIEERHRALLEGRDLSGDTERRQGELLAGAAPLYVQILGVASRAYLMAQRVREAYGDDCVQPEISPFLTQQECRAYLERRDVLISLVRKVQRELQLKPPRRPVGRPPGSTNKKRRK